MILKFKLYFIFFIRFQSTFATKLANDPTLDAWNGARKFASTASNLHNFAVTRSDYDEKGGDFIKEYFASNSYFPCDKIDLV